VAALFLDHLTFPLNLELMEGDVLSHVRRLLDGEPLYPEPSPAFVPLAYNPLYYVVAAPFAALLGASRATLRLVAVLGAAGSAAAVYQLVRRRTGERWWGLVALGLFAASYRATDTYLDTAHADSWFLFCVLAGTACLERAESPRCRWLGVALLAAGFWLKQHGAWFVAGGLAFLVARRGWRRLLPELGFVAVACPFLYLVVAPRVFGPAFHYFTWTVPSGWSALEASAIARLLGYVGRYFALPAVAAAWWIRHAMRSPRRPDLLAIQLCMAAVVAAMGSLDAESNNNVFLPLATWLVVVGSVAAHRWSEARPSPGRTAAAQAGIAAAFVSLVFDPTHLVVSREAKGSYHDLVATLDALPGRVYAPSVGALDDGGRIAPPMTWVALDDLSRGRRSDPASAATLRAVLAPLVTPATPTFILTSKPLDQTPAHSALVPSYRLHTDFGERFAALRGLPRRWGTPFPRYLYVDAAHAGRDREHAAPRRSRSEA
jgi:4-amino-4-deoxy-L-arabinose transferase-like glycosyltransferase